jgi:uncharacterized membrane protein YhaH (DUF805 family)
MEKNANLNGKWNIKVLWRGRLRRLDYFIGSAFLWLICISFILMVPEHLILVYILFLPLQIPLAVRRFHDFGYYGWNAIAFLIPGLNSLVWLMLVFTKGDTGKNKYGEPQPDKDVSVDILVVSQFEI